jgi:hypothetical protein
MALVTANGFPIVAADFVLPATRVWHIDMTVDCGDASKLNGAVDVDIADGQLIFSGTASIEDVFNGTARARVIAGKGGMAKPAQPKSYQQVTVKVILGDLLGAAGESQSATADVAVLATQLDNWCVTLMPVADAVGLLLDHVGAVWRMLPDGTFWCGHDTWPDSGLAFTVEHDDKAHQQIVVTLEAPLILPGTALDGRNASYVETHVDHREVRSTVWLATAASPDRLRDPAVAMTRSALSHVDFLGLYRCNVVTQSGQSFDLVPEDERLPPQGFKAVPLRSGIPGLTVQVPAGSTLLLGWLGGDPSQPYCMLWQGGEAITSLSFGSSPDNVVTKADIAAIKAAISGAAVVAQDGGSAFKTNILAAWPTSVGSQAFKVQR